MGENKFKYKNIILAILIFALTFIASVFLFAAVVFLLEEGLEFSPIFATVSLALGGLTASLYLGNFKGEKGILIGGAVGIIVFIVTALITLLVNSGAISFHLLLRFIIIILASLIGAIIGVNKKQSKKII